MDNSNAQDLIARYAERMNRMMDAKEAAMEDLRELKIEIKANGLDVSALTRLVKWRRKDEAKKKEMEIRDAETLYATHVGVEL